MGELGSIFGESTEGERGPDLRCDVQVSQGSLGTDAGHLADVPAELDLDGQPVARVLTPGDPPGKIVLRLPETFASGSTLRLRGQGGRAGDKTPGDLYLRVTLVPGAASVPTGAEGRSMVAVWLLLAAAFVASGFYLFT